MFVVRRVAPHRLSANYSARANFADWVDNSIREIIEDPKYKTDPVWRKTVDEAFGQEAIEEAMGIKKQSSPKPSISSKIPPSKISPKIGPTSNSKAMLTSLALAGAAGAIGTGAYFFRKRQSKNGKTIVERVRKKQANNGRFNCNPNIISFNNAPISPSFNFSGLGANTPRIGLGTINKAALIVGAIGAGTYYFRKRKSKNGKQIIERVRR